jgi:hypothetical protein
MAALTDGCDVLGKLLVRTRVVAGGASMYLMACERRKKKSH